jgi:hypothetical protein
MKLLIAATAALVLLTSSADAAKKPRKAPFEEAATASKALQRL